VGAVELLLDLLEPGIQLRVVRLDLVEPAGMVIDRDNECRNADLRLVRSRWISAWARSNSRLMLTIELASAPTLSLVRACSLRISSSFSGIRLGDFSLMHRSG
jgi:hypothetical protein